MLQEKKTIRDRLKDKIINDIRKKFLNKRGKRRQQKKKQNGKTLKDNIIRDIRTLFEQEKEENYYELKE